MTQDEIIKFARQVGYAPFEALKWEQALTNFAKLVAAKEQDRCCSIIYGMCESDNVAERTVKAIRKGEA